jgi:hypothetical protein
MPSPWPAPDSKPYVGRCPMPPDPPTDGWKDRVWVPLTITGADAEAFIRSKGISFYGNQGFEVARPDRMAAACEWLVQEVGAFLDHIYQQRG